MSRTWVTIGLLALAGILGAWSMRRASSSTAVPWTASASNQPIPQPPSAPGAEPAAVDPDEPAPPPRVEVRTEIRRRLCIHRWPRIAGIARVARVARVVRVARVLGRRAVVAIFRRVRQIGPSIWRHEIRGFARGENQGRCDPARRTRPEHERSL